MSVCRRKVAGFGFSLLLVIGLWCVWAAVAHHRLQARIEAIRAAGEPLLPQDFPAAHVADDQNAAKYFADAATAMNQTVWPPGSSNLIYSDYPPFPPEWHRMADAAVAANARALGLARQSRKFDRVDWQFGSQSGGAANNPMSVGVGPISMLNQLRGLAILIGDAALHAQIHGDDAEAIERIEDGFHLSNAINGAGYLFGNLVAIGCDALMIERLDVIAPGLHLEGAAHPSDLSTRENIRPVRRAVLEGLIRLLLDPSVQQWQRNALIQERTLSLQNLKWIGDRQVLLRPMLDLEIARTLDVDRLFLRAAAAPDWPSAKAILSGIPADSAVSPAMVASVQNPPPRFSRIFQQFRPNLAMETNWRWIARGRATAVSLAAQLYRADHGRWPASLDDLKPHYLTLLPLDPLGNGSCVGYLIQRAAVRGGFDRPLVYFNAATNALPAPPAYPSYDWGTSTIQWLDVSRWSPPPTPPAATAPY